MDAATQQEAIVLVEGRASVIGSGIELVRGKVGGSGSIGFGEVQHVEAEQGDTPRAHRVIHDQLVLVIDAA